MKSLSLSLALLLAALSGCSYMKYALHFTLSRSF